MLLAVLVLYNRGLEESEAFSSLFGAPPAFHNGVRLLVYDNSPAPMHVPGEFEKAAGHIKYVSDTSNPGVSRAYNAGARLARKLGCSHLLLLDQDTLFPKNAISAYMKAAGAQGHCPLFAPTLVCDKTIYSPCRSVFNIHFPLTAIKPGWVAARGLSLLNSGMCISVDAFEIVGGFDEAIPLDFADHDFFRRYRKHFDSFIVLDMVCEHGFSDGETRDVQSALNRFGYYCLGAKNSIKGVGDAFSLPPLAFVRAVRLSLRFGSTKFLRLFFRTLSQN